MINRTISHSRIMEKLGGGGMGEVYRAALFRGLGVEETAEVMGISPRTVKREWSVAKLWLLRELKEGEQP